MKTHLENAKGTAVRVEGDDGRFYGVVEFSVRKERWRTRGAAIGPLAVWHPDPKSAIDALVAWQEAHP